MTITRLTQLVGIGAAHADRVRRYLGRGHEGHALEAIRLDPYLLMTVPRIGFRIADRVARTHFRASPDSPRRHAAGNRSILEHDGSLPAAKFDAKRAELELYGADLAREGVDEEHGRVWLSDVLAADVEFARWVADLPLGHAPHAKLLLTPEIDALVAGLDADQRRAALCAVAGDVPVICLTGDAGTGKTHVIAAAARLARHLGLKMAAMAFAGKAADRIRQALDAAGAGHAVQTGTIHRMLGYNGTFTQTLKSDLVVLDECSMIPTTLLWAVVKAMKPGARLILVGDPGQLPPVGHGQPFADLIALGAPRLHLSRNYRQAEQLDIVRFAAAIREGREAAPATVELHVGRELSEVMNAALAPYANAARADWQVITLTNADADEFNLAIQELVNPWGMPLFTYRPYGGDPTEIRVGDKVLVRANDYEYGVFNGQLGTAIDTQVVEIVREREAVTLEDFAVSEDGMVREKREALCVRVRIGTDIVAIPLDEAPELLKLGYAITVHKAQGSDWDHVVVYQRGPVPFDGQRWWYTSVTRARTRLTIAYEVKAKGDEEHRLATFWLNAHKTLNEGPSIFVGRVKKELAERRQAALFAAAREDDGLSDAEQKARAAAWLS